MNICKHCHSRIYLDSNSMKEYGTMFPKKLWRMRKGLRFKEDSLLNWCENKEGYTKLHTPMSNLEYLQYKYESSSQQA